MKKYLWLIAILGTLIIFGYINNIKEALTPVILFWTFIAIFWYAKETQSLKEATIKRPILTFQRTIVGHKIDIELKNYGEGVAREVEVSINNVVIHKIPFVSSIYSSSCMPLAITDDRLKYHKDKIVIIYWDPSKKIKYTTEVKWDDSIENRDKCKIIKYYYSTS